MSRPAVTRILCFVVAALVATGSIVSAQPEAAIPAGKPGDAVRAYLAAINAADSTKILAWLKRYDPEGDLVVRTGRQLAVARRTGGFTVTRIIRSTTDALETELLERKAGGRVRLLIVLGADGIAEGFGLEPMPPDGASTRPPESARPAPRARASALPEAELPARLGAFVDSLARTDEFSGAISLSRRGVPVLEKAYGFADATARTPNTLETAFNLGSINKIFTATAIRQLAASGRLNLDSTLARAWPTYPNREVANKVTVSQLLGHTSGIMADIFDVPGLSAPSMIRHNSDFLRAVVNTPLAFAPGSREQYSNAGYVVLGGVIGAVSGEDYYQYIERHVYKPAGMMHTGHNANTALPKGTAIGYTRGETAAARSRRVANTRMLPGRGSAAGGGYSTIGDLKKLLVALRGGAIAGGPPAGLGVAGGAEGMNAVIEGDLPGGYDLIVLSNFDPPSAERIARQVRIWLGVRD